MASVTQYTTYENTHQPHVTIHFGNCSQLRKHGGIQKYNQGRYKDHATYNQAHSYAVSTSLPLIICSFCKPS